MEEKETGTERAPGSTTIAPNVLLTIARLTALQVPGVVGMAAVPGGVNRLFKRGIGDGVRIEVEDDSVAVDLYVIMAHDVNAREVSRNVQAGVTDAIENTVGMQVTHVDIHIEDISFGETAP
jgi:uncharacterized alkaline shock family protein YloU